MPTPPESARPLPAPAALENTEWRLVRLGNDLVQPASGRGSPHLILSSDGRRLSGFTGCNRLTGAYTIDADQLRFGRASSSEMACPQGMALEQDFLNMLAKVRGWRIQSVQLELLDGQRSRLAVFETSPAK